MSNCKDCKHWSRFVQVPSFGRCGLVNFYSNVDNADDGELVAIQLIGESFTGDSMMTRPEFGCIQFETKP